MIRAFVFTALVLLAAGRAHADGPFGIEMGAPISQLDIKEESSRFVYKLNSAPNPYPEVNDYRVKIHPDYGVCQVFAATVPIDTDRNGAQIKNKYRIIMRHMMSVYGKPKDDLDLKKPNSTWISSGNWMMAVKNNDAYLGAFWYPQNSNKNIDGIMIKVVSAGDDIGAIFMQFDFKNTDKCLEAIAKIEAGGL